jgi:hypothetical protein
MCSIVQQMRQCKEARVLLQGEAEDGGGIIYRKLACRAVSICHQKTEKHAHYPVLKSALCIVRIDTGRK